MNHTQYHKGGEQVNPQDVGLTRRDSDMSVKIYMNQPVLCRSCRWGTVFTRQNNKTSVHCNEMGKAVPPDIRTCSEYEDKSQPSRHELEKIAWQVRTDRSGKIIGFERGKPKDE